MNIFSLRPWLLPFLLVAALFSGCEATVPVMSAEHDEVAEKFQPPPGKANIYIVRKETFAGSAVLFKIDLNGKSIGGIAPGTYHLIELEPGKYTVSVTTAENEDHETLDIAAGENHFLEIKPKMGWLAARVSVERVGSDRGRELVIEGERAESLPLAFD